MNTKESLFKKTHFKNALYVSMKRIYDYFYRNPNSTIIIFGVLMVLVYELPFVIFGDNSWIRIHDCLDDTIAHIRMVIDSGALFDHSKVLPILYGIKRSDYIVNYSLMWIIFSLLPTYWAFLLNDFIVRLIAYWGMYMILSNYVCDRDNTTQKLLACLVSVCFSYISFYTIYGLSAAGIPMLFYAFLNLANHKQKVLSYILIALFAFYSSLVLSGVFVGFVLILYWVFLMLYNREYYIDYFWGLCLLGVCYLIVNIDIFITFFMSNDFISHRIEFGSRSKHSVLASLKEFCEVTQYHSGELPVRVIIGSTILAFLSTLKFSRELKTSLVVLGAIMVFIAIGGGLNTITQIEFLRTFQFDRFYFLLPAIWMIVFFCSLKDLAQKNSMWFSMFFVLLLSLQIYNHNPELKSGLKTLRGGNTNVPTFRQFYDTRLFDRIAKDLDIVKSSCKVVSVGMHPAVAEYNGFHCLDGYVCNYRLDYKHKFREVIQGELDKSEGLKNYYDTWGSRCYVFSADEKVGDVTGKDPEVHTTMTLNTIKLKQLGCQYIFSAVFIDNYEELGLKYLNSYTSPNSYWNIIVYAL